MQSVFIFVYGTLMFEFNNPMAKFLRSNTLFIGKGHFNGLLFDLGNFPGATYEPGEKSKVYGEIYQTDNANKILKNLDEYEGIDDSNFDLYERKLIPVVTIGEVKNAETYILKKTYNSMVKIKGGNYYQYLKDKS